MTASMRQANNQNNMRFSMFAGPANSKFTAEDTFAHLQHVAARANKGNRRMSKYLGKRGLSPTPSNFNIQFLVSYH